MSGALVLSGCGGDSGNSTATPSAPAATDAPDSTTAATNPVAALVTTGAATPFKAGNGQKVEVEGPAGGGSCRTPKVSLDDAPVAETTCTIYAGAGGPFAVLLVYRGVNRWDFGVLCASDDGTYNLAAAVVGITTPVVSTLTFNGLGTVAGVVLLNGELTKSTAAEVVLISRPTAGPCPSLHGLGPVAPTLEAVGGTNVVGHRLTDGSLGCTTYSPAGFVTQPVPAGEGCKLA
ncbi:MAG: hypothetical protein ABIP72_06320 [Acidimicrobiales bacterium]